MKKIGLLSDTHGLLRPETLQALEGCDAILHGGDINRQEILDRLGEIAPVYVVRGNNDREWAEEIPYFLDFTLSGLRIYMTHKKKDLPKDLTAYDLVLYGHSHKYEEAAEGKTLLINPGSCGPRRFHQEITLAILWLREQEDASGAADLADPAGTSGIGRIEKIVIPHEGAGRVTLDRIRRQDIELAIREIEKGRSVGQVAARTGLSMELAEQVCRMYLTHPGVDAEGIMTKLGL
ncbi:MAG: metallophosphoesterase family protein [Lachnospiraceae bacterium]|nr:metallophosphoesterase family protein [Lachnospiraceae bacterium]